MSDGEKRTAEGLKKGEFVIGPIGEKRYLFCVNKVLGKHHVEAITHIDGMVCTVNLRTYHIHGKDSEWQRVEWREEAPLGSNRHGTLIETGYMAPPENVERLGA